MEIRSSVWGGETWDQDFAGWGNTSGLAITDNAGQVLTNAEAEQTVFDELLTGQAAQGVLIHALRPNEHLVGDGFGVGAAIGLALGEDMPGRDEQPASDGDDGLIGMLVLRQALVHGIPKGIGADSGPGRLTENPAKILAALFGDGFLLVFLSACMDTGPKTGIADQFFGMREARDVANGSQDGHRSQQAKARDLHKEDSEVCSGLGIAELGEFLVDDGLLGFKVSNDFKIELNLKVSQIAELLLRPPGLVFVSQQFALRRDEIEALNNTVKTIFGHGELLADARAKGD